MARLSQRLGNMFRWVRKDAGGGPVCLDGDDAGEGGGVAVASVAVASGSDEPASGGVIRRSGNSRDSAIAKLEHGYNEVVDLLQSVRNHMETQSQRSERLVQIMEGLPDALRSLPEASRNQARMLETIESQIERQTSTSQKLTTALEGLARSTEHHDQSLDAIQEHLAAGQHTGEKMLSSLSNLNGTLGALGESNHASTGLLRTLAERSRQTDEQVRELFHRNQKHMTIMSVVSWSLAIVALTVAGYVAVSVSRLSSSPSPSPSLPGAGDASAPHVISQPAQPTKASPPAAPDFDQSTRLDLKPDPAALPPADGFALQRKSFFAIPSPSDMILRDQTPGPIKHDELVAKAEK
jgi:hypothetical protein